MAIDSRPALGDLAEGVEFFDAPGGTSVGKVSFAQTAEVLGVPMDHSTDRLNLAWRAVWLYTKAINGVASRKVVYVATTGLTNLRPIPAPAVPGPEGEYLPVVTAAQTLYVRK